MPRAIGDRRTTSTGALVLAVFKAEPGLAYAEIARRIGVSKSTVVYHLYYLGLVKPKKADQPPKRL